MALYLKGKPSPSQSTPSGPRSGSGSSSRSTGTRSSGQWPSGDHDYSFDDDDGNKEVGFGLILGDAGSGKTTFITDYMPDPLTLISYDYRAKHAVKRARAAGRRIGHVNIDIPSFKQEKEAIKLAARETVEQTIKNLEWSARQAQEGKILSIGLDGGTEFSGLLMTAYHGNLEEVDWNSVFGRDAQYIRRQWLRVFRILRQSQAHVIITIRAKEVWKDNKPSGEFEFEGHKVINEGVDFAAYISTKKGKLGGLKGNLKVTKGGVNREMQGVSISEAQWDQEGGPFASLCGRMYGVRYEEFT